MELSVFGHHLSLMVVGIRVNARVVKIKWVPATSLFALLLHCFHDTGRYFLSLKKTQKTKKTVCFLFLCFPDDLELILYFYTLQYIFIPEIPGSVGTGPPGRFCPGVQI